MKDIDRYRDRPILMLLEYYVRDCISPLSGEDRALSQRLVDQIFDGRGDWKETVRSQLGLSASLDDQIQSMWSESVTVAEDSGSPLDPGEFAEAVVEENFTDLVEMVTGDLERQEEDDA